MHKYLVAACLLIAAMFAATTGFCDTLIIPVSGASYSNPTIALPNSEPDTEEMFLENILGYTYDSPSVFFIHKEESYFTSNEVKDLSDWSMILTKPWLYAVVKVDGKNDGWYAYQRDDADGFGLTVPNGSTPYRYGISHVSFFGATQVPEPAALVLLGLGLIGIGAAARRKMKE